MVGDNSGYLVFLCEGDQFHGGFFAQFDIDVDHIDRTSLNDRFV